MEDKKLYNSWKKVINENNIKDEWVKRMLPNGYTYAKAKENWTPAMWSMAQRQSKWRNIK